MLILDGRTLTIEEVAEVSRRGRTASLADTSRAVMDRTRAVVESRARAAEAVYGVNTGFGSLSRHRIDPEGVRAVQRNLVRSHAAGVGSPLPDDIVRGMMLLTAASLARGQSGARPALVDLLLGLLDRGVTPVVPSRGSVGASGDLAPLAHVALVLIGEGEARIGERIIPGGAALREVALEPATLEAKEGLALINGTHLMAACAALALHDAHRLTDAAVQATAMAIDACRASDAFLDDRIHAARGQLGQRAVAERLRGLLSGSTILPAHREDDPRVQDPYCLRAAPVVLGAALDAIDFVRAVVERELGAVTDNPLVLARDDGGAPDIVSGANFHGMPLAIALDTLAIALTHVAGIAERRIYWLLAASDSENPVNIYLSPQPGLHSGLMIAQYTAAACCNELQTLATPASVGNIPTSAGIEDYNSFGATSALQVLQSVELARSVVAIELLVMAEAIEYQRPLRSGPGVEAVHDAVRSVVPRLTEDRPPAPDIERIAGLIRAGSLAAPTRD